MNRPFFPRFLNIFLIVFAQIGHRNPVRLSFDNKLDLFVVNRIQLTQNLSPIDRSPRPLSFNSL